MGVGIDTDPSSASSASSVGVELPTVLVEVIDSLTVEGTVDWGIVIVEFVVVDVGIMDFIVDLGIIVVVDSGIVVDWETTDTLVGVVKEDGNHFHPNLDFRAYGGSEVVHLFRCSLPPGSRRPFYQDQSGVR